MQRYSQAIDPQCLATDAGLVQDIHLGLDRCLETWGHVGPVDLEPLLAALFSCTAARGDRPTVLYADLDLDEIRIELTDRHFCPASGPDEVRPGPADLDLVAALSASCGTTSLDDSGRVGLWARLALPAAGSSSGPPAPPHGATRGLSPEPLTFAAADLLEHARLALCWSLVDLWSAYVQQGGAATQRGLRELLAGGTDISSFDYDLLALVLNDEFAAMGVQHPLPYSDWFSTPAPVG